MAAPLFLLRHLPGTDPQVPDGELLRRYSERRDEAAFAELVRRNGPLVLRACRNALRDPADADDAFQSAFVLLARHAPKLTRAASVAGWLHTVAVRSAGKIRRGATRRQARERAERERLVPSPAEDALWTELRERIDAELARLPDAYRLPLLLCYVQGLSYADAARRLGCSPSALRGRLERGRELLRGRLGRWGLPAVLVAVGASAPAVGAGLRESTLTAVRAASSGAARALGGWAKWTAAVVLGAAVVAGGLAASRTPVAPSDSPPSTSKAPTSDNPGHPEKGTSVGKSDAAGDPLPVGALARMGSSRFYHGPNIQGLTVSPNGKWIVSDRISDFRIWDIASGREHVPDWLSDTTGNATWLGGNNPHVWLNSRRTNVIPVGDRLVTLFEVRAAKKRHFQLRDAITGEEVTRILKRSGDVSGSERLVVSADGKWATHTYWVTHQDEQPEEIVDLADLTVKSPLTVKCLELGNRFSALTSLAGDGRLAAFSFGDGCEVWDLHARALKFKVPAKRKAPQPDDFAPFGTLSPDGKTLAVVHPDGAFELWDTATGKQRPAPVEPFGTRMEVKCFSPDSKQVMGTPPFGSVLRVWDVMTGQKVRDYHGGVGGAAFTPDGKRIAIGWEDVKVLDAATGRPVHDFGGHTGAVWQVRFTLDGRLLTWGWGASALIEWHPRTGRKLSEREFSEISYLNVSQDGKQIVTLGTDQKIRLWSSDQRKESHVIALDRAPWDSVRLSPDGKEFVVGGEKPGIQVFDTRTGRLLRTAGTRGATASTEFSPNGQRLVLHRPGQSPTVIVWDWPTTKQLCALDFGEQDLCSQKAFSADGRLMAIGDSEGHIYLFDLSTGKRVHEVDTKRRTGAQANWQDSVHGLAFSPDGRLLATGAEDGRVRVWELATGGERFQLRGHRGSVLSLAFSRDGTLLVSGSSDRSAVTWDATGAALPSEPKHQPKNPADAWARLADRDAAVGFAAVRYLSAHPVDAIRLLTKGLRPVPAANPKTVAGLVEKLGSEVFAQREEAEKALAALSDGATNALRAALAKATDAEMRQRLTKLLAPWGGLTRTGDRLRAWRAVEVLERTGTPDAQNLLHAWAGGVRGAELTEAARAALARLDARSIVPKDRNEPPKP